MAKRQLGRKEGEKKRSPKRYLTKRLLLNKSRRAITEASEKAMEIVGYVVIVENNQVIKKYKDGKVELIEQLEPNDQEIKFD